MYAFLISLHFSYVIIMWYAELSMARQVFSSTIRIIWELSYSPLHRRFRLHNISVEVLHASKYISNTIKGICLKPWIYILDHCRRSLIKNHNSDLYFNWIIPLFGHRKSWLKFCVQVHKIKYLKNHQRSLLETLDIYSGSL